MAERIYQLVFQTCPDHRWLRGEHDGGRVAFAREGWSMPCVISRILPRFELSRRFEIAGEFRLRRCLAAAEPTDTNNVTNLKEAIGVFSKIHELNETNAVAARAWGEIGNCRLQLATQDAQYYAEATNAYQKALALPAADVATRSQARVGLGIVAEKLAESLPAEQRRPSYARRWMPTWMFFTRKTCARTDADPYCCNARADAARLPDASGLAAAIRIYDGCANFYRRSVVAR